MTKTLTDGTKIERSAQQFGPRLWRCVETIYRADGTVIATERGFASHPAPRDKWIDEGFAEADGDVIRTIDQYTAAGEDDDDDGLSCPACDADMIQEDTPDPLFPAVITSCPSCGHYE